MAKRKINPGDIQHVDLENVRHSDLGGMIECMQESISRLEMLYLIQRDNDPVSAKIIERVLKDWDDVAEQYEIVR